MTNSFPQWLATAVAETATRRLLPGEALFRQGDAATAVFALRRGRITLLRHLADGTTVAIHTARGGESFAEAALFSDVYHCDAVAQAGCEVAVFAKTALLAALVAMPELSLALNAALARQVQGLRTRLELRNIRPAPERLLRHLRLAAGSDGTVTLDRPLKELAAEIGLTHEALYRTLAALARAGHICRAGRRLRLLRTDETQ